MVNLDAKDDVKSSIKHAKLVLNRHTNSPTAMKIKVAFFWTTVKISNFHPGISNDNIFVYPKAKFKGYKFTNHWPDLFVTTSVSTARDARSTLLPVSLSHCLEKQYRRRHRHVERVEAAFHGYAYMRVGGLAPHVGKPRGLGAHHYGRAAAHVGIIIKA